MKLQRISMIAMVLAAPLAFAQVSKPTPTMPAEVQAPLPTQAPQDQAQQPAETPTPVTPPAESTTPAPLPPQQPAVIVLPEKQIETKVDLKSGAPQSGQNSADARKEAINSLPETKAACRRESSRDAQAECLRHAMEEYNAVMARTARH